MLMALFYCDKSKISHCSWVLKMEIKIIAHISECGKLQSKTATEMEERKVVNHMNKTIIRIAKKENLDYKIINYANGVVAAEFEFPNYAEYSYYWSLFEKKKGLHVETFFHSFCIRVFDAMEYAEMIATQKRKIELSDLFCLAMREGKTADQAKEEQERFCVLHPEYKPAYDLIYA